MYHKGYYYNEQYITGRFISERCMDPESSDNTDTAVILMGGTILAVHNSNKGSKTFNFLIPKEYQTILQPCKFIKFKDCLSEDITETDIFELKQLITNLNYTKIIILHGTDTVLKTASYISLCNFQKCILFVCTQKSPDKPSSEAYSLLKLSKQYNEIGTYLLTFKQRILKPNNVNKVATYKRHTFISRPLTEQLYLPDTVIKRQCYILHHTINELKFPCVIIGTGLGNVSEVLTKQLLDRKDYFIVSESMIGPVLNNIYDKINLRLSNNNVYYLYWYLRCI